MFHTFEELNVWLGQRCRTLWAELVHPQYNGLTVAEVVELEQAEMMPMRAKAEGKQLGRPVAADTTNKVQRLKKQGLIQTQVASELGVGIATVKRHWNAKIATDN